MAVNGIRPVIVVGTDGSGGSVKALRWALRHAEATGAEVRVVLAWEVTAPLGYVASVDDVDWVGIADKSVAEALQRITGVSV